MPFARIARNIRLITAAVLFGILTLAGQAQEPPAAPTPQNTPEARPLPVLNYSQPVSHFPTRSAPTRRGTWLRLTWRTRPASIR